MRKLPRWQLVLLFLGGAFVLGVACLAIVGGVGWMWATSSARALGEPTPEPATLTVALPEPDGPAAVRGATAAVAPHRVVIDLEGGRFEVRPGPAGTAITVDGTFAPAYYELTHEQVAAGDDELGGGRTFIRFQPKQSVLVQFAASVLFSSEPAENHLQVVIPRGLPIDLTLRLQTGESEVDLGGLHLTNLDAELAMGRHQIDFSSPLAGTMEHLRLEGGMGEFIVDNLGNANARVVSAATRMGAARVDLGGAWSDDAPAPPELSFESTMGELRLAIPSALRIATDSSSDAVMGGAATFGPVDTDGAGPEVKLRLSATMGEARIRRY